MHQSKATIEKTRKKGRKGEKKSNSASRNEDEEEEEEDFGRRSVGQGEIDRNSEELERRRKYRHLQGGGEETFFRNFIRGE